MPASKETRVRVDDFENHAEYTIPEQVFVLALVMFLLEFNGPGEHLLQFGGGEVLQGQKMSYSHDLIWPLQQRGLLLLSISFA